MSERTAESRFIEALRECLGLAPLGGERRRDAVERFAPDVHYVASGGRLGNGNRRRNVVCGK